VTQDAQDFLFSANRYFYDFEDLVAGNLYRLSVAAFYNGVWSTFSSITIATVPGLLAPLIQSITGTRTVIIDWLDLNLPPENETKQLLQIATNNVVLTENSPTSIEILPDVVSRQEILANSNVIYQFRMKAINEDNGKQSAWSPITQYADVITPPVPQLFDRNQTSIEVNYTNYNTATLYEIGYKLSSDDNQPENWENFTVTYSQAVAASFRKTFSGLESNTSYDIRYRVLFTINNNESYTPYAIQTITTLAPFELTATPTVTTVSNTYNSITIRVKNNEPGSVAVYAKRITDPTPPIADLDPVNDLIGVIPNQNGTLDIPFTNLPDELEEYFFAVQVRILNESKLRSNLLLYSEFTSDFPEIGVPTNWRTISTSRPFSDRIDWEVGWGAPTIGAEFHTGYEIQEFTWPSDFGRPNVTLTSPGVFGVGTNVVTRSGTTLGDFQSPPRYTSTTEIRVRSVNSFGKKSAYTTFRTFSA
jgi:hypothetical protein